MSNTQGNRSRILEGVDGRTIEARRFKDIFENIVRCLGDNPSPGKLALAKRATGLTLVCERFEVELANGNAIENGEYSRTVGHLSRAMDRLQVVDISPTPGAAEFAPRGGDNADPGELDDYLESRGRLPVFRPPKKTRAKLKEFVSGSD